MGIGASRFATSHGNDLISLQLRGWHTRRASRFGLHAESTLWRCSYKRRFSWLVADTRNEPASRPARADPDR